MRFPGPSLLPRRNTGSNPVRVTNSSRHTLTRAMKESDGLSESYVENVTGRLRRFVKDFGMNLEHVTTRALDAWLRKLGELQMETERPAP